MPDDFEAELNAIMGDTEVSQETTQPAQEQTQPASTKIKAGGREFTSVDELSKAYGSLEREFSSRSQRLAKLKEWEDFADTLKKNPDLRDDLTKRIDEYNARRAAGQSKATAEKHTGVSDEVAERLHRMEREFEDMRLERELTTLKNKYGLDEEGERELLQAAADMIPKYGNIPLEMVYRHYAFERKMNDAASNGERSALENQAKKGKANVGSSASTGVSPTQKPIEQMDEYEYLAQLDKELSKVGYHD